MTAFNAQPSPTRNNAQLEQRAGQRRATSTGIVIDKNESAQSAFFLTTSLILLQAADGVLTSMGVSRYGVAVEGNPFLRWLMTEFGNIPTLGFVKCLAIIFILALSVYARKLPWIRNAMGAISCVYLFAAVLPWTYVLFISEWL